MNKNSKYYPSPEEIKKMEERAPKYEDKEKNKYIYHFGKTFSTWVSTFFEMIINIFMSILQLIILIIIYPFLLIIALFEYKKNNTYVKRQINKYISRKKSEAEIDNLFSEIEAKITKEKGDKDE